MYLLGLAVIGQSLNIVIDKYVLNKLKIPVRNHLPMLFLFLAIISFIAYLLIPSDPIYLNWVAIFWLGAVIFFGTIWNLLYDYALAKDDLGDFESFILFVPLLTIILAAIFFPAERNSQIIWPALLGSLVLIATHIKKSQVRFSASQIQLVWTVLFMALEIISIRQAVNFLPPTFVYTARTCFIALILFLKMKPDFSKIQAKVWWIMAISAGFGAMYRIVEFTGYASVGVVYTVLFLTLSPFLVVILGHLWLKETWHWKYMVGLVAIAIAVLVASMVR